MADTIPAVLWYHSESHRLVPWHVVFDGRAPAGRPDRRPAEHHFAVASELVPLRTAATRDGAPHRVFKISELSRLIASELVFTSQKSTANPACACRPLEGARPQRIMGDATVLLSILPKETWYYQLDAHEVRGLEPR